ncbi:helix-turn-helix transcriptional regulator [Lysinibacillus xylanilyticus]|uniref:YafY family transcriptional regulator n=1 Tax=Lysinibacillus xylanilyticus TaxID=582475 RepID=A0ABT4EUZ3_9BACI|nr:YafY family protein [Lysinibacillus xylanilyticus]MCY9549508.1 YafY family transcriptional regulator [Lysinibacillus xylanilyticus]MED3804589.1 YafY family protein [Lysinibacillus xylanilyticus]
MHKAQRLIQLIMKVNERKKFTIQEMAEECGVSRRTMIRDLMELSELGVPLYSETGPSGGYRVLREKVLPPISFTEHEAIALFFACQSLRNYKALPFKNEVNTALDKFFHYLSSELKKKIESMQQRLIFWVPPLELNVPFLKELLEAALEQHVVTILYEVSTSKSRVIQPLGIYTMNGLWYCQAYCFLAEDYRVFRVDRVKDFSLDADQSLKLNMTNEHIKSWIMPTNEDNMLDLEVDLTPEGVRRCQSEVWLSQWLKLREDGFGTIRTKMNTSFTPWIVHFFLGLGMEANVKHPQVVREQIKNKLQELIKQYE